MLISKLSVDSEILFVSCAHFTVLYCCIGHYAGKYVNIIIDHSADYFATQMNLQDILHTNVFWGKWGDEAVDHKMVIHFLIHSLIPPFSKKMCMCKMFYFVKIKSTDSPFKALL